MRTRCVIGALAATAAVLAPLPFGASCVPVARAQQVGVSADNAATLYLAAWNKIDAIALQAAVFEVTPDLLQNLMWQHSKPTLPPEVREEYINDIVTASRVPNSSFNWDRTAGPAAEFPHLGHLRASGRMLALEAREAVLRGDGAEAARLIAAGYRVAAHAAQDEVTIASTYASSIFLHTDVVAEHAVNRGLIDADAKREVLAALQRLNPRDPFNAAAAVRGEMAIMIAWMDGKIIFNQNNDVAEHLRTAAAIVRRADISMGPIRASVASRDAFHDTLNITRPFFTRAIEHWNDDDAGKTFDALEEARRQGILIPLTPETVAQFHAEWLQYRRAMRARVESLGGTWPRHDRP